MPGDIDNIFARRERGKTQFPFGAEIYLRSFSISAAIHVQDKLKQGSTLFICNAAGGIWPAACRWLAIWPMPDGLRYTVADFAGSGHRASLVLCTGGGNPRHQCGEGNEFAQRSSRIAGAGDFHLQERRTGVGAANGNVPSMGVAIFPPTHLLTPCLFSTIPYGPKVLVIFSTGTAC